jgi:hypothetical protein
VLVYGYWLTDIGLLKMSVDLRSSTSDVPILKSERPKLLSTIGATSMELPNASEEGEHSLDINQRERSGTHKKPEAVQRNKRLFGALMGHLGVAKRKLEEDSSNVEKKSALHMAVTQKNGMENMRLQQLHREASDAQRAKVHIYLTVIIAIFAGLKTSLFDNSYLVYRRKLFVRYFYCVNKSLKF